MQPAFPVSQWLLRRLLAATVAGAAAASERQSSVPRSLFILNWIHQTLTLGPLDFRSQSCMQFFSRCPGRETTRQIRRASRQSCAGLLDNDVLLRFVWENRNAVDLDQNPD
jgi:hypothetical protein